MAQDLPFWRPLEEVEAHEVDLDFSATEVEPYVPPYVAPSADAVDLDFWGDYTPGESLDLRLDFAPTVYRYEPPAANAVDLNFDDAYTPPLAGAVDLAFGGESGSTGDDQVELTILAPMPAPQATITLTTVMPVTVAATLNTLGASVTLDTDINVYRAPSAMGADRYQHATRAHHQTRQGYSQSDRRHAQAASGFQQGRALSGRWQQGNHAMARHHPRTWVRQQQAAALSTQRGVFNHLLPRLDLRRGERAQLAAPLTQQAGVLNHYLPHRRSGWGLPYEQASAILARHWGDRWQPGEPHLLEHAGRYEQATWPPPGTTPGPQPPGPDPDPWPELPDFYRGSPDLDFCRRLPVGADLDIGADPCEPDAPVDVPIQRTYLVSNSASLTLVATGQALEASAISVAIDADSWAWELRATVIGDPSIAAVRDAVQPAEVEAVINGRTWRCVIDDWRRDRAWGQLPAATLSARSLAAYLGAPHAAARSYTETQTRTAQQLAEQELPLGWTLDWQIDDWLVEPEAWHYTGRTPIDAITAIATAAGAVVQAHPSQPQLIIAPRYSAPHWAWDGEDPDVSLPPDILTRLGSEYRPREPLNAVYVSGETTGVLALVKRTGTAGDRLGEMVVDPLITRQAAARGRGIAVLSASGEQTRETLALPVADDLAGLLATGQLLRVDPDGADWRGLVRAVSVAARLEGSGNRAALVVEQTAELERHLEETA